MSQFRLHIDIPLGTDKEAAVYAAKKILEQLKQSTLVVDYETQFRLGFDTDRQRSNHLDINTNGHVSNKKLKL